MGLGPNSKGQSILYSYDVERVAVPTGQHVSTYPTCLCSNHSRHKRLGLTDSFLLNVLASNNHWNML